MKLRSKVLIIAGSDSSGGAGIQADIKTVTALGSYAMTAVTAVTAQNTKGVKKITPIPARNVQKQIIMILNDIGAGAVNHKFIEEIELSRNWHWIWSKFYFNKKNFGILKALKVCLTSYISSIIKFLFYFIVGNKFKKRKYFNRAAGFYNALLGKDSWYRPDLKD